MTTAIRVEAPPSSTGPAPVRPLPASTEAPGKEIAALAARLHAGTYELLVLLREFDDRITWNNGFASCAHWLHSTPTRTTRASGAPAWRTGIALGAARAWRTRWRRFRS